MSGEPSQNLKSGAAFASGARIWSQASSALLMFASTALLTPLLFGEFALANSIYGVLAVFVGHGLYEYVMNNHDSDDAPRVAFVINVAAAIVTGSVAFGVSFFLSPLFHTPDVGALLRWLIPALFAQSVNLVMESVLLRRGRLSHVARAMVVADTAGVIAGLAIMTLGGGVYGLVAQRVTREMLLAIGYGVSYRWRPKLAFNTTVARDMFGFASGIVSSRLANTGASGATDIIIGLILSPAETGLYRLASRFLNMAWDVLNYPFRMLLWVKLPPLQNDSEAFGATMLRMLETFGVAVCATLVGIAAVAHPAFELLFRPEWVAAAPLIGVLAIGRLVDLPTSLVETVVSIRGKTRLLVQLDICNIAIGFSFFALAAPYGLLPAVWAQVAAVATIQLYILPIVARHSGLTSLQILHLIARLAASAAIMFAVVFGWLALAPFIGVTAWPRLLIGVALGVGVYVVTARRFTPNGAEPYISAIVSARDKAHALIRSGKAG